MKITRSRLAALATVVVVGLSGCAAGGGAEPAEQVALDAEQTLTVWGWSNAPGKQAMDEIVAGFEELHPNVTVEYNEIVNTDYANKATLALTSEQDIDVMAVFPNTWAGENESYLVPVAEWPGVDGIEEQFQELPIEQTGRLFSDGELRALPFGSTGSAVGIYNAQLVADAGLSGPPKTWDEMQQLADGLATTHPDAMVAAMPSEVWFQPEMVETMVGQVEPDWFNEFRYDDGPYGTPEFESALTRYAELYADGALNPGTLDLDYASASALFDSGKAAILFNGTWEAGRLLADYREANGLVPTQVGIMPVPSDDPSGEGSLRSFLDIAYGIPVHTDQQAAAAAFIEYVTVGAGVDIWGPGVGFIPAVEGWEMPEGVLTTPLEQEGYETLVRLVGNPHSDRNNLPNFANQVGTYTVATATGSMTPAEATEKAQADWDSGMYN